MIDLNKVRKLAPQDPLSFGVSTATPILSSADRAGMMVGVSQFMVGELDVQMSYDEVLYIVEGELQIDSAGESHKLRAGDFIWLPAGSAITYRATAPCHLLYAIPQQPREAQQGA